MVFIVLVPSVACRTLRTCKVYIRTHPFARQEAQKERLPAEQGWLPPLLSQNYSSRCYACNSRAPTPLEKKRGAWVIAVPARARVSHALI